MFLVIFSSLNQFVVWYCIFLYKIIAGTVVGIPAFILSKFVFLVRNISVDAIKCREHNVYSSSYSYKINRKKIVPKKKNMTSIG